MVSVIATDHTLQPCAHRIDWLMHSLTQLCLDGVKRCPHPLRYSPTAYDEKALGVRRTVVREPQKREGGGFAFTTPLPGNLGEATEFDQSRLVRMELQRERR